MELQNEFEPLVQKFKEVASRIEEYAKKMKKFGLYKDFERELAWESLCLVKSQEEIYEWTRKYKSEDIDTLIKKALKEVYLIEE